MVSAFLLCVSFEVMGLCEGFGAYRYSRRLTPCGRGLMAPPGLTALGAKGSVLDRLTPPGRVEGSALGSYEAPLRWRGTAPLWAPFFMPPLAAKTFTTGLTPVGKPYNRPAGVGNASPFGGWRHHLSAPLGSVSFDSQSPTAPCESSSLATTSWWDYGYLVMEPCLCRKV